MGWFQPEKKKYDKIKRYIRGVKDLFLEAEITCGAYKLSNCTKLIEDEGMFEADMATEDADDLFKFQTKWVPKDTPTAQLYIPYLGVKYGAWSKPTRNYTISSPILSTALDKSPRASHNDSLTFPMPPMINAPIRIAVSGKFFHIDRAMSSGATIIVRQADLETENLNMKLGCGPDATYFVEQISNVVSYFLLRKMSVELVRRDEDIEREEEIVLASTLNERAFEHRTESLALSTDPALPSISKSLLRTLKESELPNFFSSILNALGGKIKPIVTLPAIRGKLICGSFRGTLEELYIAEQYTHYATRRNSISGSFSPVKSLTLRHEGKTFLVTKSDYNVLRDAANITIEEIKPIHYNAEYIERK